MRIMYAWLICLLYLPISTHAMELFRTAIKHHKTFLLNSKQRAKSSVATLCTNDKAALPNKFKKNSDLKLIVPPNMAKTIFPVYITATVRQKSKSPSYPNNHITYVKTPSFFEKFAREIIDPNSAPEKLKNLLDANAIDWSAPNPDPSKKLENHPLIHRTLSYLIWLAVHHKKNNNNENSQIQYAQCIEQLNRFDSYDFNKIINSIVWNDNHMWDNTGTRPMYPLNIALSHNLKSISHSLLDRKTCLDTNKEEYENKGSLHFVQDKALAQKLIDTGANLNAQDAYNNTPLHTACHNTEIAELLLLNGADVNAQNKQSQTPLHLANSEVAHLLITHKADIAINSKVAYLLIDDCWGSEGTRNEIQQKFGFGAHREYFEERLVERGHYGHDARLVWYCNRATPLMQSVYSNCIPGLKAGAL